MTKTLWSLLLLCFTFVIAGCPDTTGDDDDASAGDDDDAVVDVIITDSNPSPDEDNFFFAAKPWVRFDRAPDSATLSLAAADGTAVASTDTVDGTLMTLDAGELSPSTDYALTIEWSPCNGCPTTINFATGPYGNDVTDPATSLVGSTYNIDLAQANFVEPPGVGPILQSQIGDIAILFSILPESSFEEADQPGLQILGALGAVVDPVNNVIEQEDCTETLAFTAGPDGEIGTADDTPAEWANPNLELGPTNLDISVQGIQATIQDLVIAGTFHPEGDDLQGATFAGKVDTRPLAPELDPEGGEDAVCNLVEETIGISCENCTATGEPFCLSVLADSIVAAKIDGLALTAQTCMTIIDRYTADNTDCPDAVDYDEDGDGVYEGCGDYAP